MSHSRLTDSRRTSASVADGQIVDHAVLPNSRSAHGLYMVPVTVNDKVYAYLVVSNHEPLSGLNLTIIENATICALEIMRFKASLKSSDVFGATYPGLGFGKLRIPSGHD